MTDKLYPKSGLPIRRSVELLPTVFQTDANDKFLSGVVDPLIQPGVLEKIVGYIGRRYGKTYNGKDIYVDSDQTLRSRYQLEPGVVYKNHDKIENFYDYLDFKNQIKFFGNIDERDDKITSQQHYTWKPPVDYDKFINYREYFWEPSGPPSVPVLGQNLSIVSTYKVTLGTTGNSFIFSPDSFTNNPTITLYRGQTYKFKVNAPGEGFVIRTNYDTGSLLYRPYQAYRAGQQAISDGKLYKAKQDIPAGDGSSITIESQDWEFIENISSGSALDYNFGVENNGIENGTLTFTVPYDSPDSLFYQGFVTPDRFGRFIIADIESNSYINVDKDIIGKITYKSSNDIEFTNGLVVEFRGNVSPSKYASDTWLVEGVGTAITLTRFSDLTVPVLTIDVPEILFDNEGFDTQPFDDAAAYPTYKDYITIARNSKDNNPWSRYNRWFHRSVLEYSYNLRGQDFLATETLRAKRPIIEFTANLQLINHGSIAKESVDYIDAFTTDIFSKIEGSSGYNIDGEFLFEGARILVIADTDNLSNNKIYQIKFILHNGSRQIHLVETEDSESILGQGVLVKRGNAYGGKMFHFDGTQWKSSQEKTLVNQPPLFDVFDSAGVSLSDEDTYPVSTFAGSKILSYKIGNGPVDTELGFSLSYLNINNVGDIQFNWDWESDQFQYTIDQQTYTSSISANFYKLNELEETYGNGWIELLNDYVQPIVDSQTISATTNSVTFSTIDWDNLVSEPTINFYLNGKKIDSSYSRNRGTFEFSQTFVTNDVLTIKIVSENEPDQGFYEIPVGIEKNPLNQELTTFTLGQAVDHVMTALEFNSEISGTVPGNSNLRDISDYQKHAKRFLKHSGISPLVFMLLCDKTYNIVKSLQYSKKSYTDFKNNFLTRSLEIEYNNNIVDFVDDIIADLNKTKTVISPFSQSDMIGCGAYTSLIYDVDDVGIKTFSLSEKFNLNELSSRAVYVYINDQQLLAGRDYEFNSTFGFVSIIVDLTDGDRVEIREYVSTSFCHIPPTPTSMGLYKKYTPMKFIDDTYVEPREVIQGHDGSITAAYGDFRDDLLLELEYRIYNNIKVEYDEKLFDIDSIFGGYYNEGSYTKSQLDDVTVQEFLKWVQHTNINYTLNTYLDSENSFTYTYSNMTDPTGKINLPGYWRGIYQWFYDTDRPHRCPWEMLGFSEKPTWWDSQYGPAPYTSGNLLLWEDLRDGIIRQGPRAGTYDRYKRPTLTDHIPVDADGRLLSPLDSGLARDFSLINNQGPFVLGDIAPVEYAWRSSSEWPFAIMIALSLMKPFEFITRFIDVSKTKKNILNQIVNIDTNEFSKISDIIVPEDITDLSAGLIKYLISYIKSKGISIDSIQEKIDNLDVRLSNRLSGFVDQNQQRYLLDSKNPGSTSSSVFVPQENYEVIFNISSPIDSVSYSGVILEKTAGGWIVTGYDDIQPYFNYYSPLASSNDPLISVGGVSENFLDWTENKLYSNGTLIRYKNDFYRALRTHNSETAFNNNDWKKLPGIPKVGSVEALRRKTFNRISIKRLSYGSKLTNIQQVVDFLLGYEQYLISTGFTFDRYDPANQVSQDWLSACKEFMFWTKHNWAIGSLITLSPGAEKLDITVPVGVADNILDGFYDYQILKADGKPLFPQNINVNRTFQNVTVTTVNTTDGIYYLKLYYVLKEHVTVFDDRTVFNDVIYDKTTGYRQERIKSQGFRTVDWDGDYTSPGFLFDNVNIQSWQPFVDYKLGDIVSYRSYNWTSLQNQIGAETFDETAWSKLDTSPEKQLVSNFDYKIKQFSDYYEVSSNGINESQRFMARHATGYQERGYLQNLSDDSITQFQLYQGFIREKGTSNAITKVFGKLSRSGSDSIVLNEEWAVRVGRLGGVEQLTEIEIQINKDNIELNPQPLLIENSISSINIDQYYRVTGSDFTVSPLPFNTNINPVTGDVYPEFTAGYVNTDQIEHVVETRDLLTTYDISTVNENDHIWIIFDKTEWNVLRLNESPLLYITDVSRETSTTVVLTLSRAHGLLENSIVGLRDVSNLTGFFKVLSTTSDTITLVVDSEALDPELDISSRVPLHLLSECRFSTYQDIDQRTAALFKNNSKIFVDDNGNNLWEVVQKKKQYSVKNISDYGISTPLRAGTKVVYDNNNKNIISSIPGSGYVGVYVENNSGLQLKQIISTPPGYTSRVRNSFGQELALSSDGKFLIVGSPLATDVTSEYKGEWDANETYAPNDVVLHAGRIWRANNITFGDGSTDLTVYTDDWEIARNIKAYPEAYGEGYIQQGMISIYVLRNNRYEYTSSFVSPRPSDYEKFGTSMSVAFENGNYYLAVSAPGARNNTGRVYFYSYSGVDWYHQENTAYRGIYDPAIAYREGDIVWQAAFDAFVEGVKGNLWRAIEDTLPDGSTLTVENQSWIKVSDISTSCSVPSTIAIEDDGSTLEFATAGILSEIQLAETVKPGDMFGASIAMSSNGSILIVGAPEADGQWFPNYRGLWRPDVEYIEGEVVKYKGLGENDSYIYYRLEDTIYGPDSAIRSYNEDPSNSALWQEVGDSSTDPSGKVFVYKRTSYGSYELKQMINAASLSSFSDLESGLIISTGDQFGFALDIDASGDVIVISSPKADINFQDQGSVYIFNRDSSADLEYRLVQKLESFEVYPNEYFGCSISISPDKSKIAVGAKNSPTTLPTTFDILSDTIFDNRRTTFYESQGYTGGVYVFDRKDQTYFLTEKLQTELSPNESFGHSVDIVGNNILVGSPDYRQPQPHQLIISYDGPFVGNIRLFKTSSDAVSWETLQQEQPVVDLRKIRSIELYDDVNNVKIQDIDYIDPAKGKILNVAEQEIKFKTSYDPAVYSIGTDETVVDPTVAWLEKNKGMLWWDLSKAKWLHYEQDDLSYRKGSWSQLAPTASIDVYEWVESQLLPSEWAALADTNEGVAEGISGQPLYPNDDVYSIKEFYNENTGAISGTLYYYWVKNKAIIPSNTVGRTKPASEVASIISNPQGTDIAFIALIDSNQFLIYNFDSILTEDTALLNIQYRKDFFKINPINNEYQLLTEGVTDSLPTQQIENKWIDSLVGYDISGNRVPDSNLPAKQKYGILYRPRQSMFVDRFKILKTTIENINIILSKEPFADIIDFTNLNLVDSAPSEVLGLYDVAVDNYSDLQTVGTVRTRRAVLKANIVNGELDTIDIVDPGFGYKPKELFDQEIPGVYLGPPISIEGDGEGATASCHIDGQGRIITVVVTRRGKKYRNLTASARYFSVLVNNDSTINNGWSIYSWDDTRRSFFRSKSQSYDTTRYWSLVDWWKDGYSTSTRIVREINTVIEENSLNLLVGDIIRVKEYASGGWAVFEKTSSTGETFLEKFVLLAREKGTIEISSKFYDTTNNGIGFDTVQSFDTDLYDLSNTLELRNILKAVKENIFIGDYSVEWNNLFFSSIRYVFAEQQYVDWAFKTSFLNATHNVGNLDQRLNYKNDNLESYQDYINEVKPYRTTIREYSSLYDSLDQYGSAVADFDLPSVYSAVDGGIVPVKIGRSELDQYPWKWWADNTGYSVEEIRIYDSGEQYTVPPKVLINGNGTGAEAQAYISNGRVSGIKILNSGSGYTEAPTVTLVGGNPGGTRPAKAVAILGNSNVRTFDLTVKFDRISKTGIYASYIQEQTFTASGLTSVFELNYAPTRDKSKINVKLNGQIVLNSDYTISLYYSSSDSYSLLRGKLILVEIPQAGDVIVVSYEKNDSLLDSVNRIDRYYSPTVGMKGKELGQLMTGIDFGGVQIQGTTFDVTGGWDALPWFTDNWDSVEASSDYYVICDGSTTEIILPYVPADGQKITIYIKRSGESVPVRIDNEYYSEDDSSTGINPTAEMPTFVGNGTNNIVEIGSYIQTSSGDILIFRPIESDGSVTITDPNLLDSLVSGGSFSALNSTATRVASNAIDGIYSTARGVTAEEIVITGGKFIEPDHVPAPEENIPGQVLDSVSIKVYHNTPSGSAPLQSKVSTADGTRTVYSIGQTVLEQSSVLVYIDGILKVLGTDYTLDLENSLAEFNSAPVAGKIIEIISVGIGGLELLDYQEFIADGQTQLFLTNANYEYTSNIFVTVNGTYVDVGFKNSTDVVDAVGRTLVEFPFFPAASDVVRIICMRASADVDSTGLAIVRVNKQTFEFEGSTRSFDIANFVELSRGSAKSSMIVELNGIALRGVDSIYNKYDGITNSFLVATDPEETAGSVLPSNLKVYVNSQLLTFIQDYDFDGPSKILTIQSSILTEGDEILIVNDLKTEYYIEGNNLIIDSSVSLTSPSESENDIIELTWFSEYPTFDLISDEKSGGKVSYTLQRVPLSVDYVWVYKNGTKLIQDKDYWVSLPRGVVYLNIESTELDIIKTITFGNNIFRLPSAFEIQKDMLNTYHFTRHANGVVKLSKALNYFDTTIEVDDASSLTNPITSRNIPGIIEISGEKIEYLSKTGNVLSQLRRGVRGTPIGELYPSGADVIDKSYSETIPYNETQDRLDFVSDGSTLLVGPLNFVPTKSSRLFSSTTTIPSTHGPCDEIEVFAAGRRLRKDTVSFYNESLGAASPAADLEVEAEFSVDGTAAYIRLTEALPAGTRITIIRKTGNIWYERGDTTASKGLTLFENATPITTFIAQKSTSLPE